MRSCSGWSSTAGRPGACSVATAGSIPAHRCACARPTRNLVVTAVPLLVHEQAGFFDYLNHDFGKGGMLKDKEVWAFSPNTLTVYAGDTVHVTVVNPGDDPHTFTISEMNFSMNVKGQS